MKKSLENYSIFSHPARTAEIDIKLSVMVVNDGSEYVCFLKDNDHGYTEMFGLPVNQQSFSEAMEIAIANAPEYIGLLFEDEEI